MSKEVVSKEMARQCAPLIRFNEFKEIYSEEKVETVFSIFNGYAFPSSSSQEIGCRWVKIADVGINKMKLNSPSYLPIEFREKYSKFVLRTGDFVLALTRPILNGDLKISKIDNFFDGALLNQRVGKIISINDLNYVYFMLQQNSLISRIENRIAGTDPPNLSPNEIASLKVWVPSLPEQKKIATFLSSVDKKIQQLTRKKELLETYKKGLMQQLFSGELRFKDEKGKDYPDWEEKLYGDVYSFYSTNSFSRDNLNYESGAVKNIHYGDIHTKFSTLFNIQEELVPFVNSDINIEKIKKECYCQEGDLVIADASEDYDDIGKAIELVELNNEKIVAGLHTFLARPDKTRMYIGFSGYLVQAWYIRKQIMTIAQGTKVLGLSTKRIANLKINIPSLIEQEKISSYLSNLDSKIENMANQITKTQTFKKGLLQQMFV